MNSRRAFIAVLFATATAGATVAAARDATPPVTEAALHQQLQEARWPADIVRLTERYLAEYPQGPAAHEARAMLEPARRAAHALDRNVRLYRGDFRFDTAPPAVGDDIQKAALADGEAALRVAHAIHDRDSGSAFEINRYVGWLQFASALGNGPASYELALQYRKADQPALAAPYELRAEELGFRAPPSLDNIRK
jgi:hypothetical protein